MNHYQILKKLNALRKKIDPSLLKQLDKIIDQINKNNSTVSNKGNTTSRSKKIFNTIIGFVFAYIIKLVKNGDAPEYLVDFIEYLSDLLKKK